MNSMTGKVHAFPSQARIPPMECEGADSTSILGTCRAGRQGQLSQCEMIHIAAKAQSARTAHGAVDECVGESSLNSDAWRCCPIGSRRGAETERIRPAGATGIVSAAPRVNQSQVLAAGGRSLGGDRRRPFRSFTFSAPAALRGVLD